MKLYHPYRHRPNQIFEFGMGKDEKRRFNHNRAKYPDDKCLLHYQENPIEYKTNNYGFRSPEDIVEGFNGNVYIGCSHTWGSAHHWKNTWVSLTNEKIGGKCLNLGVPGSGIGTGARILHELKDFIKPKNIFCHYVHPYRYEYWDWVDKNWRTISPNFNYEYKKPSAPVTEETVRFLAEEEYTRAYYRAQFALVQNVANYMGAKLHSISFSYQGELEDKYQIKDDTPIPFKARDLVHNYTLWHQNVADRFYKAYIDNEPLVEFPFEHGMAKENKHLKKDLKKLYPKKLL